MAGMAVEPDEAAAIEQMIRNAASDLPRQLCPSGA